MTLVFIICVLAIWRITHLFHIEDGPFNILFKLRQSSRKHTELFDCFLCLSIWIALPFSFLFPYWFIFWFGLSAGAILINSHKDWMDNF